MARLHREEGKALISDDDEFFRVALRSILGHRFNLDEIIETTSFDEALDCLTNAENISLALFDLAMPGMDNPASLRAVRESFPDTRVAVVSGSRRRRDILSALEAGVHGYVPKGLGVMELGNALESIVRGTIYVPPSVSDISTGEEQLASVPPEKSTPDDRLPANLTPRQTEVLHLIVEGKSNKEIARALGLGEGTVKVHLAGLLRNLGVSNRSAAAAAGARLLSRAFQG